MQQDQSTSEIARGFTYLMMNTIAGYFGKIDWVRNHILYSVWFGLNAGSMGCKIEGKLRLISRKGY